MRLSGIVSIFFAFVLFSYPVLIAEAGSGIDNVITNELSAFDKYADSIYTAAGLKDSGLDIIPFKEALTGYFNIKVLDSDQLKLPILSIIDFTKKSIDKRLWIIDLANARLLFNTLVAHGKNTGEQYVARFSNEARSNMSSLGFYLTAEIYNGKHGMSLALDGLDEGFNSNARKRSVVVHAAEYVSEDFINKTGRIGRSLGCPALPVALAPKIISTIANGSCLYIYYPDAEYEQATTLLNKKNASAIFEARLLKKNTSKALNLNK